jgi:type II secretory pathway predicted ATPase ExeA
MYLDHFGLNEPPFRITPHTDFFFAGANRGATLEALLYAITHDEGIVKVTGEVGSGKTMLCRVLMEQLPENVETVYLANPSLSREEILFAIADELKVECAGDRPGRLLRALLEHLIRLYAEGRRVVVLVDEAHAMPRETLEEVRLLSNLEANRHKLLQIVLFGQPELNDHLNTAAMRQLMERITHAFRLEPLVRGDIERYIDFRMRAAGYRGRSVFSADALRLIAQASEGLTRRINILADKSLLAAFAASTHVVRATEARRAIRDSEFYRRKLNWRPFALAAAGLAGGLALGAAAPLLLSGSAPEVGSEPVRAGVSPVALAVRNPAPTTPVAAEAASSSIEDPPGVARSPAPGKIPTSPTPPSRGDAVKQRFAATQAWLNTAPGDHYAIQLITVRASELDRLEDFLLKASKVVSLSDMYVYSVKIDGVQCYRAAYGLYPGLPEVLAAMRGLPLLLLAQKPYHRSVERMRSQNRQ